MNSVPCSIQVFPRYFHIRIRFSKEVLFQSHFKRLILVIDQSAISDPIKLDAPNHIWSLALESSIVFIMKSSVSKNYKMNRFLFALEPIITKILFYDIWNFDTAKRCWERSTHCERIWICAVSELNSKWKKPSKWILFYLQLICFLAGSEPISNERSWHSFPHMVPFEINIPNVAACQIRPKLETHYDVI